MNNMTLLKAMGDIDDKYIEEAVTPASNQSSKKRIVYISSFTAVAAAMALVVFSTGILNKIGTKPENEVVTIANPMIQCADMDEAANLAGFRLDTPDSIKDSDSKDIYVFNTDEKIIEITYYQNSEEICTIRKGAGNEDVSGDYNQYDSSKQVENNGVIYTLNSNSDFVYLVTWTCDDYSYSCSFVNGVKSEEILDMLIDIK